MPNFNLSLDNQETFEINTNDTVETFVVKFGETTFMTSKDFNDLDNRPSYNGSLMTGDTNIPLVPTKVSDLENDADYQTEEEVETLVSGKQDKLTAGTNITIDENNVISAEDTTYTAGNGLNLSNEKAFSIDTTVVATQQNLATEVQNRENADTYLQGQIDAISASSDVVDIVGTHAELEAYDTQHLKDNDIIKVLQDSTQNNATTYYRWSTSSETFTLIGQEGPYYTKSAADAQFVPQTRTVNSKALSANITLDASDVSAVATGDVVQTTGTGVAKVMSQKATTDALGTKLNISDYVVDTQLANSTNPVQNKVINSLLGTMPSDFFTADATVSGEGSNITLNNTIEAPLSSVQLDGDTFQQTYSGKNLFDISKVVTRTGTVTNNNDGTLTVHGYGVAATAPAFLYIYCPTLKDGDTVTLSGNSTSTNKFIYLSGVNAKWDFGTSRTITTADLNSSVLWYANDGSSTATVSDIQIEYGTTTTSWEKYVGGTASPNPDYPQDINVVTGEQTVTVTGKNLFNYSIYDGVTTGTGGMLKTSKYYTQSTEVTLNLQPSTAYRLSLRDSNMQLTGAGWGVAINGSWVNTNAGIANITTDANGQVRLKIGASGYADIGNYERYIQLEQNSSVTSYEPYQSTTKKITLGNMFDATTIHAGDIKAGNVNVRLCAYQNIYLEAGTYTFSSDIQSPYQYVLGVNQVGAPPLTQYPTYSYESGWVGSSQTTFTLTQAGWLSVQFRKIGNATLTVDDIKPYSFYLNRGSTVTTPIELAKIGTYRNNIFKNDPTKSWYNPDLEDNAWYVHKEISYKQFDGTENWAFETYSSTINFAKYDTSNGKQGSAGQPGAMSNIAIPEFSVAVGNLFMSGSQVGRAVFCLSSTDFPNSTAWTTYLAANKPYIYYALATPTDTKITDATLVGELEALWNAYTYVGTTHIATTATGLPAILTVEAFRSGLKGIYGAIGRLSK